MKRLSSIMLLISTMFLMSCSSLNSAATDNEFNMYDDINSNRNSYISQILPVGNFIPIPKTATETFPNLIIDPMLLNPNKFASETVQEFFDNSAFVGDSVMHGMNLYSKRTKNIQSGATFLTLTSFAARHALSDVTEKSYHPIYNEQKMKVEDALALDGANKVFLFLGLNDVRVTPKTYYENYVQLITKIKEKCPNIDVFVVSTTYPIEHPSKMDAPIALSYKNQLEDLNIRLKEYCSANNMYYIDVISYLSSPTGFLDDKYTSDNYVHLTNKAYSIWSKIFENYANELINNGKITETFVAYTPEQY